jgi:hypothetical protein
MFPVKNFVYNEIVTSETIPVPTHDNKKLYREGILPLSATWRWVAEFLLCLVYCTRKSCQVLTGQEDCRDLISVLHMVVKRKFSAFDCWSHDQSQLMASKHERNILCFNIPHSNHIVIIYDYKHAWNERINNLEGTMLWLTIQNKIFHNTHVGILVFWNVIPSSR